MKLLREVLPTDTDDASILQLAIDRGWTVITCNRSDFVTLARVEYAGGREIPGIIAVFRRHRTRDEVAHVLRLLERAGEHGIRGAVNFA